MRLDTSTGCLVSEETRERCRKAQIKRFQDPKEREKIGAKKRELTLNLRNKCLEIALLLIVNIELDNLIKMTS